MAELKLHTPNRTYEMDPRQLSQTGITGVCETNHLEV